MNKSVYKDIEETQKQGIRKLMTPLERIQDALFNIKNKLVKKMFPDKYIDKQSPTFMKVVEDSHVRAAIKEMTFLERVKDIWHNMTSKTLVNGMKDMKGKSPQFKQALERVKDNAEKLKKEREETNSMRQTLQENNKGVGYGGNANQSGKQQGRGI